MSCVESRKGYMRFYIDVSQEVCLLVFFFSSRRRHTRFTSDWSSDVCSSDLHINAKGNWSRPVGFHTLCDIHDSPIDHFRAG